MIDAALESALNAALAPFESSSDDLGAWRVAFSGGLDSTVLLHALASTYPKQAITAVHINHGLSPKADAWQAQCEQFARALGVAFVAEQVSVIEDGNGLEEAARKARYDAFEAHSNVGDVWLLGHHQDDQIETFFMRLMRGSGVQGLASMAQCRRDGARYWLRPLLKLSKTQLRQYALKHELSWVEDESNQDIKHERNWWRHDALPVFSDVLERRYDKPDQRLAKVVDQLERDKTCLAELLAPWVTTCLVPSSWPGASPWGLSVSELQRAPAITHTYIVREWLHCIGQPMGDQKKLGALLDNVCTASHDAEPELVWGQGVIRRHAETCFWTTPAALSEPFVWSFEPMVRPWCGGELSLSAAGCAFGDLHEARPLAHASYQVVAASSLSNSARLKPVGRPHKTLKHLFQEAGVPPWLRASWPILMVGDSWASLVGIATDEAFVALR